MEELLKQLILRIEVSSLPEKEKNAIYQEIAASLRSVVWPVVIKYSPKAELNDLAQHPSKVSLESFAGLIEKSIQNTEAIVEIDHLMRRMIDEFHLVLTKEGIPQLARKEQNMEEQLKAIVVRIEKSKLSNEDKAELYATISEGLQATVWPVLLKYMPKEQLEFLSADPKSRVTVESYAKLIEDTIKDGVALKEIDGLMNGVLTEVDTALKEEGV